jgi:hypothetical protein
MNFRKRFSLDGIWKFQVDPSDSAPIDGIVEWREATVPLPWQAQFDDLRSGFGTAWYKRTFQTPVEWVDSHVILHFGAVNYHAQAWLNGMSLGEHEGGYLPFEFEVGHLLQAEGLNELTVRVTLPNEDPRRYPDFPFSEIPHGKQSWYGPAGGIWQSVWLEQRSSLHFKQIQLRPSLLTGEVQAKLVLSKPITGQQLTLTVFDAHGELVATNRHSPAGATQTVTLTIAVDSPQAWSPDQPYLYSFEAAVEQGEETVDAVTERFGFRTIEARAGRLWLNGEPLYLRGALDQDYYPDTICVPPSTEFLEDQIRKAKAMGLNCFRCHIKVPDPRYYEVADRLGMLIWTDLPNWGHLTEQAKQRAQATLQGMLERDGDHPSIIAWTIINEDWGTDLVNDPNHRAWLKETYHWLKQLDPTRLVVDNSACIPNFHVQTDIEDYHYYRAVPDHRQEWDGFVSSFASRPHWTYSPQGDAIRTGDEPLVMSEFGNWGLPDVDLLIDDGQEPWWFETGEDWNEGAMYPHGVKRRFHTWHLDRVFGSWQAFVEAAQWQQYRALKYQIEVMRQHPSISGYVITELVDAHWEANGLMDIRRNPRAFHADLAAINADTVITPRCERVATWSGEPVEIALSVAHGAGQPVAGAQLRWKLSPGDLDGHFEVPHIEAGQVQSVGTLSFLAPTSDSPVLAHLDLTMVAPDGSHLATNRLTLTVFPQQPTSAAPLWSPNPPLAEQLVKLGYQLASTVGQADIIVTDTLDETLMNGVRQGKRVLLLANQAHTIGPAYLGIRIVARKGTPWAGDWASSFAWLRRERPFAQFPGGPLLDFGFDGLVPEYVLTDIRPQAFESDVHAGIFVGWIHKMAALIVERRYGLGKIVLSTFQLTPDLLDTHPMATTLLAALIELASTDRKRYEMSLKEGD